jgi:nucleotide-binding universal stress UspA family protein
MEVFMTVAEMTAPVKTTGRSAAFRHIMVATDFSEPSRRALCDALALAAKNNAQVSVVHVLPHEAKAASPELDRERIDAESGITALAKELRPEQEIASVLVKYGTVSEAVTKVIEEEAVDLLVIGTRERGRLQKLALGSVAEQLLRVVPCPVMTIGPKAEIATSTHEPGLHAILFATDYGKGSVKALPLALALARQQQAKLIMLHMFSPMPATTASMASCAPATAGADEVAAWVVSSRNRALKELHEFLPAETGLVQAPEYVVGTDFLAEGILTAAGKFKVDLIVMGANHAASARMAAHNPWTAVHEVVQNAPCPVLTVAG